MRTSVQLVWYLACLFLGEMAHKTHLALSPPLHQERGLISAHAGEDVTLQCFYEAGDSMWLSWYKQTLGQEPRIISSVYMFDTKITYLEEFKGDPRFSVHTENRTHHLTIYNLRVSDSATYYCAATYAMLLKFAEGTVVNVRGERLNIPPLVQQPESESVQPGGSVTLSCTVHTGTCDGEHSVYWFRSSEESHPGFVYGHGGKTDQCERKATTRSHTCNYTLPTESLNPSHAGTYYCAVAACGRIVIGNGTKLDFRGGVDSPGLLAYFLSAALTLTTTLLVFLIVLLCKANRRNRSHSPADRRSSAPSSADTEGNDQDADSLHYAALSVNLSTRPRTQRSNAKDECVYSSVRQQKQTRRICSNLSEDVL